MRTRQKSCGCLGHRLGLCAKSKVLLIEQTSEMLTIDGESRRLTLLRTCCVWLSGRLSYHLRAISSGWFADRARWARSLSRACCTNMPERAG